MRSGICWVVLILCNPVAFAGATLVDDEGNHFDFSVTAKRVITLAPHLAEQMFAIGAGDLLAGTTEYSDYPEAAIQVPRMGDAFRFDYERILAANPDLVLAWGSGTPVHVIEKLRDMGFRVAVLTPAGSERMLQHLRWLATATGRDASGVIGEFQREYSKLQATYADRRTVKVFFQISTRPLFTINGDHPISELIRLCGGENIFADLPGISPAVDPEAVVVRDPDVIVSGSSAGNSDAETTWLQWQGMSAVRSGNIHVLDNDAIGRYSPGMLSGAEALCEIIEQARR